MRSNANIDTFHRLHYNIIVIYKDPFISGDERYNVKTQVTKPRMPIWKTREIEIPYGNIWLNNILGHEQKRALKGLGVFS